MKHIRHDKVLGEVVGHYDEYGGVLEQDWQNDADINSHYELCQSEFDMDDSRVGIELRIYKGIAMDADLHRLSYGNDVLDKGIEGTTDEAIEAVRYINSQEFIDECEASFKELPLAPRPKTHSGIAAWHKKCYDEATEKERNDTTPSEQDPDQSWGEPREEFI